jgi:multisubunit Na+/H+ antiporter MnhE subunit
MSVVNGAGLALIYLLAVGSWTPWDIGLASLLAALAITWINRRVIPRLPRRHLDDTRFSAAALVRVVAAAALDFAAGSARTLRLIATGTERPGFIEVPTEAATEASRALSAFLLTFAPDSFVVHFDEDRQLFVVHVLDLARADAIRRTHVRQYRRDIAPLFPNG